jgi:hypothetical protein
MKVVWLPVDLNFVAGMQVPYHNAPALGLLAVFILNDYFGFNFSLIVIFDFFGFVPHNANRFESNHFFILINAAG